MTKLEKRITWMGVISGLLVMWACESDPLEGRTSRTGEVDGGISEDSDGGDENHPGGDVSEDTGTGWGGGDDDDECNHFLKMTIRDFDESHPDFQRSDPGWGPLAGVLESTLDGDRKPIFASVDGTHTWKMDPPDSSRLERNCWETSPGNEECYRGSVPMFEGASYFYDWYHDTEANMRFEKYLEMEEVPPGSGIFVYDSDAFFPLGPDEGFGITPLYDNPMGRNYLFTTEIHLLFTYVAGQRFTFRGDDDLWIFVNGRLALDLGGLHLPFEGTIDFDAMAAELGIVPGGHYHMDIFHAERRTSGSNFRIETNISCFIPIEID